MTSVRALVVGFVISSLSFGAWGCGGSVRGSGAANGGTLGDGPTTQGGAGWTGDASSGVGNSLSGGGRPNGGGNGPSGGGNDSSDAGRSQSSAGTVDGGAANASGGDGGALSGDSGNSSGGSTAGKGSASGGAASNAGAAAGEAGTVGDGGSAGAAGQGSGSIVVSDNGIAFSSGPSFSVVSETAQVTDTHGRPVAWKASSDQAWLSVKAGGVAGEALVLQASAVGLAPDAVYYAKVAVYPEFGSAAGDEIRVGLWVGAATPASMSSLAKTAVALVTDPIRPYVYVHDGGTDLEVYNVYSGSLVKTIGSVAARLGSLAISSDGSRLFALDATNFAIVPIDLDTAKVGTAWPLTTAINAPLAYARTHGQGLVISGNGSLYDAETGSRFAATFSGGYYGSMLVATSASGNRLCALDSGLSPYSLICYALDFDRAGFNLYVGTGAEGESTGTWGVGSNGADVALNRDGTRAFVASGAPYNFRAYDTSGAPLHVVQILPGDSYPNNIEVTEQGISLAGASVWYGSTDIWLYQASGVLLSSHKVAGYARNLLPGQLKASGDGLRLVALTSDPKLVFLDATP